MFKKNGCNNFIPKNPNRNPKAKPKPIPIESNNNISVIIELVDVTFVFPKTDKIARLRFLVEIA